MDDLLVQHSGRLVLVAVLALCLGRLCYRRLLVLHDWTHRCNIPHLVSSREQELVRYLGIAVAGLQSSCHGLRVVWRPGVDWVCNIFLLE